MRKREQVRETGGIIVGTMATADAFIHTPQNTHVTLQNLEKCKRNQICSLNSEGCYVLCRCSLKLFKKNRRARLDAVIGFTFYYIIK
jgi:hypothetical protein